VTALLEIRALTVDFTGLQPVRAVDGVGLVLGARERLAIVGESGSGKSQLLLACTGLLAANGRATGSVRFEGRELLGPGDAAAVARGRGIGFVFQDAAGSLTPHRRIGDQLTEVAMAAHGISKGQAIDDAVAMLDRVRLPDAAEKMGAYPHELSGGMRQRAAIALALVARPRVLFADEPTTALDVTVQAEVMSLLDALCRDLGMALVLVTHDLGVVAALAERVAVMYAGRFVEVGAADELLAHPAHPYTAGLLASVPALSSLDDGELATIPGAPPRPGDSLPGCRFEPRCPRRRERCRVEEPLLEAGVIPHAACHFPIEAGHSP